ncbi:MAG: MFS transporter [Oscillospiraceae bacterium]|nr:MFS transporter [Oscillospiraceae bacterium]
MNENNGMNRAKFYQLALFPMNNGATNVYFVLILTYIATFGNAVLGIALVFASAMVTGMRVFDAITDPIIGAIMDKTNGRFGKFRPFMVLGNLIMAVSVILLYMVTPLIPQTMMWLRYTAFILLYAVWVIGYTFQTSVTRSAQPVLTNDPKQRPLFTVFNTIGSLAGMGAMQFLAPILRANVGDYNTAAFYRVFTPIGIAVSVVLTVLAVIGIWEKDNEKYFGLGGKQETVKISEYVQIIKRNKPLQRLMIAGGGCKLALSIATNLTVLCMLYGCMMGNYDGLYLPMMVLGYVFSAPFFLLTVRTSQKHGQKKSLMTYVAVALICYVGVLVMLLLWRQGDPAWTLRFITDGKLSINLYTILFLVFFGVGYGAYYSTADMPIPMVADCADYETYRSGKFIPGIMGTLFSLVDKLVSSLSATVVGVAVSCIGLDILPTAESPYAPGMNWVVIVLFCLIPMAAWALTLISMRGYELDGKKVKIVQAVNAARKAAIAGGMSQEEAMATITDETVSQ